MFISRSHTTMEVVVTILDFRPRGSARFIAQMKNNILEQFQQLEIFITEAALCVH